MSDGFNREVLRRCITVGDIRGVKVNAGISGEINFVITLSIKGSRYSKITRDVKTEMMKEKFKRLKGRL